MLPTEQIFTHNFRRVRKIAKSYYYLRLSIRLSARMEQLGRNWTDFYEILYLSIFFNLWRKFMVH
jgi:hypothetical protein